MAGKHNPQVLLSTYLRPPNSFLDAGAIAVKKALPQGAYVVGDRKEDFGKNGKHLEWSGRMNCTGAFIVNF